MSISVKCPSCQADYDLDDTQRGKKLACKCGTIVTIPLKSGLSLSSPNAKLQKATLVEEHIDNTVLPKEEGEIAKGTTSVTLNTATLKNRLASRTPETAVVERRQEQMTPSSDPEDKKGLSIKKSDSASSESEGNSSDHYGREPNESSWSWLASLFKVGGVMILLLSVIGLLSAGFWFFTKKPYGISAETPLGTVKAIDTHLKKSKMERASKAQSLPSSFTGVAGKVLVYKDVKLSEKIAMLQESVLVMIDDKGTVLGVSGNFHTNTTAPGSGASSRSGHFLISYWNAIGCPPPEYKETPIGRGLARYTDFRCTRANKKLTAEWSKLETGMPVYEWAHEIKVIAKPYSLPLTSEDDMIESE